MVVAGMAAHSDISKGHEIANEVRRVNKQLKEAQGLSSTYNNRERLFGQPVTNVSPDLDGQSIVCPRLFVVMLDYVVYVVGRYFSCFDLCEKYIFSLISHRMFVIL